MKTKYFFLAAIAGMTLASCSNDEYIGDNSPTLGEGNGAIGFSMNVPALTRADKTGADAAADLNSQFIVYAEKGETDGSAPATGKLVFQNYKVAWTANSAYSTTSNTKNWEYVGLKWTDDEHAHITTSTTDDQTIKYWDYGASNYVFTAVSADPTDISTGRISITKTTSGSTVFDKGYTVALVKTTGPDTYPDLDKLFFAERNVISPTANTDRTQVNKYGGNVTLRFHNVATKVRVAMYETVPGYSVKINKFSVDNDGADPTFDAMDDDVTTNFAANLQYCGEETEGSMTIKYVSDEGATKNYPTVSFDGTKSKVLALGDQLKANVTIGTSVTTATYDRTDGDADTKPDYTSVFPNETNTQNLKLKLTYTLKAPDTNEEITISNATAEIPAEYLKWKPGYAYTYIFKISDNTNGSSGQSVVGLYPITFDAVEMIAEDGMAEYITTVSEPSITTYGVNSSTGKYVVGGSEYAAGSDIYATFMEGSTVKTPTVNGSGAQYVNIFKVTPANASLVTEAAVAEAIANPAMSVDIYTRTGEGPYTYTKVTDATTITAGTTYYKADGSDNAPGAAGYTETTAVAGTDYKVGAKINVTDITTDAITNFDAAPAKVTTVPGEDGKTITIDAVKLTGVKAGYYAIEYEASDEWTGDYKKVYKVIVVQ